MGVTMRFDVPVSYQRQNRSSAWPGEARLWAEKLFGEAHTRFLVSLCMQDYPGELVRILEVINAGVEVPSKPGSNAEVPGNHRIYFSIDGSLSAKTGKAFVCVFVVRAEPDSSEVDPQAVAAAPDLLKASLAASLSPHLKAKLGEPQVFPFRVQNQQLFYNRHFSEYRFGLTSEAVSPHSYAPVLGTVLREFSAVLGRQNAPIAYLYFPDHETDSDGVRNVWLRVGIGASFDLLESLEIDLAGNDLARHYGCRYLKYDPGLPGKSMRDRFRRIEDYQGRGEDVTVHSSEKGPDRFGAVDFVLAEGAARAGYV